MAINGVIMREVSKHNPMLQLVILAIPMLAVATATAGECEQCHKDPRYFVEDKMVFNYYQDWLKSPHKRAGVECDDCHGGDPESKDKATAHVGVFHVTDPRSNIHISKQFDTCGKCHSKENTQFLTSRHSERLDKERKGMALTGHAPACTTCHLAMNRTPYYKTVVEQTCRFCHYENNDAGLPMVARETNEILQRLNISKGYLNWTELYYKSQNWPGDSKTTVQGLTTQYHNIVSHLHSFKMQTSEQESIELMAKLRQLFDETAAAEEKAANLPAKPDK